MPLYAFRCPACDSVTEQLLPLGDTAPRPCSTDGCPGTATLKLSTVAVTYQAFGFKSTDSLVKDTQGKNFRSLQEKANEISET